MPKMPGRDLERYRLIAQVAESDLLRKKHYISPILARLERFQQTADPNETYQLEFHVVYDNRVERKDWHKKDYSQPLFDHVEFTLQQFYGARVRREQPIRKDGFVEPNVWDVAIEARVKGGELENLETMLDIAMSPIHYHYSDQSVIILRDKTEKILLSIWTGSGEYYRWFLGQRAKLADLEKYGFKRQPVEKIPFSGRTTVRKPQHLEMIKKLVYDYFQNSTAEVVLRKDFGGALIAFERITPEGKETHQAWRMAYSDEEILRDFFSEIDSSQEMGEALHRLVMKHNAVYFYPSVKRGGVRHKLVREYDKPPAMPMSVAAELSDIIHKTTNELGIPSLYAFSGSNSARDQTFIDVNNLMENAARIVNKYPILAVLSTKKLSSVVDYYNRIIRALELCVNIKAADELYDRNMLWRTMRKVWQRSVLNEWEQVPKIVPTVTFARNSKTRPLSLLADSASTCSIGIGSPKAYIELNDRRRGVFRRFDSRFEDSNLMFALLICTPIDTAPASEEEKWRLSNMYEAIDVFAEPGKILAKMDEKIEADIVDAIFGKTINSISQTGKLRDLRKFRGARELEFFNAHYRPKQEIKQDKE